jgi:predicted regulator of Ras-like GTPase activity (Roadblock/LC7/MglB family)
MALHTIDYARERMMLPALRKLTGLSPQIEASAVISCDGFPIAAALSERTDPDRLAAICASLLALAERAAQETQRGRLKQVLIEGDEGVLLLVEAGAEAILAISAQSSDNLGMIFVEARRVAQ